MAVVVFSSAQQRWVGGASRVEVEASRVADLVDALYERFPDLTGKLDGAAVAIDGDIHNDARYLPLRPDSEVVFMGAVAGGSGAVEVGSAGSDGAGPAAARDPLEVALAWRREGRGVALATVIETWGSSPCPAGSRLVVDEHGAFEGSVSGGCVEGAVIERARAVIGTGASEMLEFGVADEDAWSVGLACGGRVRIRVEPVE